MKSQLLESVATMSERFRERADRQPKTRMPHGAVDMESLQIRQDLNLGENLCFPVIVLAKDGQSDGLHREVVL